MTAFEYLRHLHDDLQLTWDELRAILDDPDENAWRVSHKYRRHGLRPFHVKHLRILCSEQHRTNLPAVEQFLRSASHFEREMREHAA